MKKKLMIVVNVDWAFLTHRIPLANEAILNGYEVYLVTKDTGRRPEIEEMGINFININFNRSGKNPISELVLLFKLARIFSRTKPDIIHQVTIKPCLYGSIIARLLNLKIPLVNAISGLGYSFIGRQNIFQKILLILMSFGFNYHKANFIFQNPDDQSYYNNLGYLKKGNNVIIKGSGVDVNEFAYKEPIQKNKLIVILPARMLFDKGIKEYSEAAKSIQHKWFGKAAFFYVGGVDLDNPAGATEEQLSKLLVNDYILWIGHKKSMLDSLIHSDIVCLPSYREGLPKALIEAMAIGRPIITTDAPGCRECVVDGFNGFKIPIYDTLKLAEKLDLLLCDEKLRISMGINSRKKMEDELALKIILGQTFNFYNTII